MPGIWKRPLGAGLGVCYDPKRWQAYIPAAHMQGQRFEVDDKFPNQSRAGLVIQEAYEEPAIIWVEKALLCDLAWAILKQFEVPHIQDELEKLQRKANV